ncbi:clan AA aspartic protease [Phormidesmis priestleyi ULC007]|jgi:clan AA aspartic protease|uniref:Clan AA aspartic protease n=1 Tax=Phormidesmis priestleyi ULC007 TaxID=1920490 RepID=A0A2T1D7C4_9CYAN|nr:clan AA aspartic protease [Phormidesmis priestleyi ULC007]PZO47354.1 MAG: clan AA aspartic protease [Phormidesmis priestleyi]
MISGYVNANREAIIQVAIVGDSKQLKSVRAIIDTGFTGDLTLPRDVIDQLGFTLRGFQRVILGDGSLQYFEMFVGVVIWDGKMREVEINAAETDSLIGMGLLEDYKLEMEGRSNGEVRITSLPASLSNTV